MNCLSQLKFSLVFLTAALFSQTQLYKSEIQFKPESNLQVTGSILLANDKIIFNAGNYTLYGLNKENLKPLWEKSIGWRSKEPMYLYGNSFFYGHYDGRVRRVAQYDLNNGEILKELDLQSLHSKPYFIDSVMYVTALSDGGKLIAYDLEKNKVNWKKNIGHGVDFQPIYLNEKIIVKAEDDYWVETDYKGNFLKTKSEIFTYVDDEKVSAKNYQLLTHSGKEITKEFLKENNLSNSDFKTEIGNNFTFLLSENYLTVIGKNGNKKLQLDLETIVPVDEYEDDALSTILSSDSEKLWFVYQNHLMHYDLKKEKVLRNVYLNKWRPHQVILDQRTIWLISKNDGQLYKLDFEPDEELNRKINFDKEKERVRRCTFPDKKRIEAEKEAQKKYQKTVKN